MRKIQRHSHTLLTHLGDAIRHRRIEIGMTQQQLATKTNLHRTYVTDVESGHRNISMLTCFSLTEALLCALSLPLTTAERALKGIVSPYGTKGGLSKASQLLHSNDRFCQELDIVALELEVRANLSKLQGAVETYAREHKLYPRDLNELSEALSDQFPINPFSKKREEPTIGTAIDEELATRFTCFLRPGELEYSPLRKAANYIIKGGGANGKALAGPSAGSTYVLSGNLRTNNQP